MVNSTNSKQYIVDIFETYLLKHAPEDLPCEKKVKKKKPNSQPEYFSEKLKKIKPVFYGPLSLFLLRGWGGGGRNPFFRLSRQVNIG